MSAIAFAVGVVRLSTPVRRTGWTTNSKKRKEHRCSCLPGAKTRIWWSMMLRRCQKTSFAIFRAHTPQETANLHTD